jgi:GNAT superfamily N-acetyltransferase
MDVTGTDDAAEVLRAAQGFLQARPAEHNLVLTLLHARAEVPEPGRYWTVTGPDGPEGVVFQSPPDYPVTITPMSPEAAVAVVDAIADEGTILPGVTGEAASSARFAGHWAERRHVPAIPTGGTRLYRLGALQEPDGVAGHLRVAGADDLDLVTAWMVRFNESLGEAPGRTADTVRRRVGLGHFVIWDDGGPCSTAATTAPVAGVTRVHGVYTPDHLRSRGYAEACVGAFSRRLLVAGNQCVLYTDLANPTSNSIYRRLGYEPISEVVRYTFRD